MILGELKLLLLLCSLWHCTTRQGPGVKTIVVKARTQADKGGIAVQVCLLLQKLKQRAQVLVEVRLELPNGPEIPFILNDAVHVVTVGLKTGLPPQVPLFMLSALLLLRPLQRKKWNKENNKEAGVRVAQAGTPPSTKKQTRHSSFIRSNVDDSLPS